MPDEASVNVPRSSIERLRAMVEGPNWHSHANWVSAAAALVDAADSPPVDEALCVCGHAKNKHTEFMPRNKCHGRDPIGAAYIGCDCKAFSPPAPSPSTREALPTTPGSVIEAIASHTTMAQLWFHQSGETWVNTHSTQRQSNELRLVRVLFDAGATREPVPERDQIFNVLYDLIMDHPMWIGDKGEPLEYNPSREGLIGDFLDSASDALAARLSASTDRHTHFALQIQRPGKCPACDEYRRLGWDSDPWAERDAAIDRSVQETPAQTTEAVRTPEPFLKTWWCPECGKTETRVFEAHYDSGHKCDGRPVIQWYRLKDDADV